MSPIADMLVVKKKITRGTSRKIFNSLGKLLILYYYYLEYAITKILDAYYWKYCKYLNFLGLGNIEIFFMDIWYISRFFF